MSGEGGDGPSDAPPAEAAEGAGGEGHELGTAEQHAADVDHTAVKIDEVVRKMSRRQSVYPTADEGDDPLDIDRTALEAILDVSSRIQDIQKKSKVSMSTLAFAQESYKDKQVL